MVHDLLEAFALFSVLLSAVLLAVFSKIQENNFIAFYARHRVPGRCNCPPKDTRCLFRRDTLRTAYYPPPAPWPHTETDYPTQSGDLCDPVRRVCYRVRLRRSTMMADGSE